MSTTSNANESKIGTRIGTRFRELLLSPPRSPFSGFDGIDVVDVGNLKLSVIEDALVFGLLFSTDAKVRNGAKDGVCDDVCDDVSDGVGGDVVTVGEVAWRSGDVVISVGMVEGKTGDAVSFK